MRRRHEERHEEPAQQQQAQQSQQTQLISDDEATLNEMIGKFDESYIYEKETDILRYASRRSSLGSFKFTYSLHCS